MKSRHNQSEIQHIIEQILEEFNGLKIKANLQKDALKIHGKIDRSLGRILIKLGRFELLSNKINER